MNKPQHNNKDDKFVLTDENFNIIWLRIHAGAMREHISFKETQEEIIPVLFPKIIKICNEDYPNSFKRLTGAVHHGIKVHILGKIRKKQNVKVKKGENPLVEVSGSELENRSETRRPLIRVAPDTSSPFQVVQEILAKVNDQRDSIRDDLKMALNSAMHLMPYETIEQKTKVSEWVNAVLSATGMSVKCPKSGLPAKLMADAGNRPGIGRFQIRVTTPDGKLQRTSSDIPPTLDLIDYPSPDQPMVSWQAKVGKLSNRTGRKLTD